MALIPSTHLRFPVFSAGAASRNRFVACIPRVDIRGGFGYGVARMPDFIVRVELHESVTAADLEALNAAMTQAGFSRFIASFDKKAVFHLPVGQYHLLAPTPAPEVHRRARAAAHTLGRPVGVLTTQGESIFSGLKPVRK